MTVDDGVVTNWTWPQLLSGVGVGVLLGGLVLFLVVVGMCDTDESAGVIVLFFGIAALAAAVYGILRPRYLPDVRSPANAVCGAVGAVYLIGPFYDVARRLAL